MLVRRNGWGCRTSHGTSLDIRSVTLAVSGLFQATRVVHFARHPDAIIVFDNNGVLAGFGQRLQMVIALSQAATAPIPFFAELGLEFAQAFIWQTIFRMQLTVINNVTPGFLGTRWVFRFARPGLGSIIVI